MGILDRLSRLFKANVNDLISKAEDPSLIIEESLREMRDANKEARGQVADAMAQLEKLKREAELNRKQAEEYTAKATKALELGREDLAREALTRKQTAAQVADGFEKQVSTQQAMVDNLRDQLRTLDSKISEFEAKRELLQARQQTAKASQTMESIQGGFDKAAGAANAFEEMERKVEHMEDRAKASAAINKDNDLDSQLKDLGKASAVDDELAALKRKLGQDQ